MGGKSKIGSQWVIEPKVWQGRTFKTEYSNRIGETGMAQQIHAPTLAPRLRNAVEQLF